MDYAALATEIAKPAYAGLGDAEIAEAINAASAPDWQDVPVGEVEAYLRSNLLVSALRRWSAGRNDAPGDAADELVNLVQSPNVQTVRLSQPATRATITALLDALVAAGAPIDADHRGALLALGQTSRPLWQAFGHRELDHGDILQARGERWDDYVSVNEGDPPTYNPTLRAARDAAYRQAIAGGSSEAEAQAIAKAVMP